MKRLDERAAAGRERGTASMVAVISLFAVAMAFALVSLTTNKANRDYAFDMREQTESHFVASAGLNAHFLLPNEQLEHRGFFQTLEHPVTGPTPYSNLPMRFSALGRGLKTSPAPTIGQHNDEVLGGELGLTRDELEGLREKKIIGDRPDF